MGVLNVLGFILLVIGIILLFGPFVLPLFGLSGVLVGGFLASIFWLPGIIFIVVGAWLYNRNQ